MKEKISVMMSQMRDLPAFVNAGANEVIVAYKDYCSTALEPLDDEMVSNLLINAKDFNIEVALLINGFFKTFDITRLTKEIEHIYALGIRTVYYADPSVLSIVKEKKLDMHCIYMPDTLITSTLDAKAWLNMGASEVVVSPLLTLDETKKFVEVEGAIIPLHGHFVMSKAGRKLLTSYKNVYDIDHNLHTNHHLSIKENKRDDLMPIYEDDQGTLIYTDYVLCSMKVMKEFIGCHHFLINSVYSDRLQICDAIHCYRSILEGADPLETYTNFINKFNNEKFSEGYYYDTNIQ